MSKADKMFEELGFIKVELKQSKLIIYKTKRFVITFSLKDNTYWHEDYSAIDIKEHLAIHEKMKELGWIE